MYYKRVELVEGEPVVFVGVHALAWRSEWGEPKVGFIDTHDDEVDNVIALQAENARLRDALSECVEWLENADMSYANGNVCNGVDEGDVLGWSGHIAVVKKAKEALKAGDE